MAIKSKKHNEEVKTLERGDIYFLYRPRVEEEDPEGVGDVQRLFMVLHPREKKKFRLAIIGQKKLPDPSRRGGGRFWGFVEKVANRPQAIVDELREENYQTKTRGERHQPAARPAGEGVYRILRHGDHTHLVYALELPEQPGEVQDALHIEEEASYILTIKNPERGGPRFAGLSEEKEADFPNRLQEVFRGRRFADADPPDFLDHEGAEFILISASDDLGEELGLELNVQLESPGTAEIFNDLRLDRSEHPTEPLLEGKWE